MTRGGLPVLDSRRIDALAAELNYRADAVDVVGRFVERLPDRLLCVHENLRDGARECALTAVLSVATLAADLFGFQPRPAHGSASEPMLQAA